MALFFCVLILCPKPVSEKQNSHASTSILLVPSVSSSTDQIIPVSNPNSGTGVMDAGSFSDRGIYLCRPESAHTDNVYQGTISVESLIGTKSNFYPTFFALKRVNDEWIELKNGNNDFWIDSWDTTNCSIAWYLRESAPAAVYGVRCAYEEQYGNYREMVERDFRVLYTQDWTYINVANQNGNSRIRNFWGGSGKTLHLYVTFNPGAASSGLKDSEETTPITNLPVGGISDVNNIVNAKLMDITIKTASGNTYPADKFVSQAPDVNDGNHWMVRFNQYLGYDIYIIQFSSKVDNRILGQFIIDNTGVNGGVNLSQLWVVLMVFGGLLSLGASSAFLVPLFIVRINEARVYKEKERIDRIKNPEKYLTKKKKSFKEVIDKIIYNIKTPVYKRKKEQSEQQKPVEEKVYSNRFTEMLRERREKRDYMQEHNVTSEEMEKIKEAEAAAEADKINSFAFLRDDDDDEIATFHAAQDEVSTLETGSYVQGGTTFAKLDSLRDDEVKNDDGNDEHDGF